MYIIKRFKFLFFKGLKVQVQKLCHVLQCRPEQVPPIGAGPLVIEVAVVVVEVLVSVVVLVEVEEADVASICCRG